MVYIPPNQHPKGGDGCCELTLTHYVTRRGAHSSGKAFFPGAPLCNRISAVGPEPALDLHSRAAPNVEAHHRVNSPNTGRNSRGRQIKKYNNTI